MRRRSRRSARQHCAIDNSGAVELSKYRKACHRPRHVKRRYFKVRELVYDGQITVEHIDTKLNGADLLTKALTAEPYHRHRARTLNLRLESPSR